MEERNELNEGIFPAYFDQRMVNSAEEWLEQGKPQLSQIFVRNYVKVSFSAWNGEICFSPYSEEFIVINGVESPIGEQEQKWEKNSHCVNPAVWPSEPFNEEGFRLFAAVDPTLPARTAALISENTKKLRDLRVKWARQKAFDCFLVSAFKDEEAKTIKSHDRGEVRLYGNGSLVYNSFLVNKVAYYNFEEEKIYFTSFSSVAGKDFEVCETSESYRISDEDSKILKAVEEASVQDFEMQFGKLKEAVQKAKEKAEARPLELQFPDFEKLEKGYPEAKLPAQLEVHRDPGVLRNTRAIGEWFLAAQEMAKSLGYQEVDRYSSNTGRTATVNYVLPGQVNPKEIYPQYISGFDSERGIIFSKPEYIGRIIGKGGENIRRIQQLTGRNWTVKPE